MERATDVVGEVVDERGDLEPAEHREERSALRRAPSLPAVDARTGEGVARCHARQVKEAIDRGEEGFDLSWGVGPSVLAVAHRSSDDVQPRHDRIQRCRLVAVQRARRAFLDRMTGWRPLPRRQHARREGPSETDEREQCYAPTAHIRSLLDLEPGTRVRPDRTQAIFTRMRLRPQAPARASKTPSIVVPHDAQRPSASRR